LGSYFKFNWTATAFFCLDARQAQQAQTRYWLGIGWPACQSALEWGSDSHLMKFSAELAVLQRGNQRHASRYSNFVAYTEWVGYRERNGAGFRRRELTSHFGHQGRISLPSL
jgi:hypothetical protein